MKKACRRIAKVMNGLKRKGLLDPTTKVVGYPRTWPARIELDRASGTYSAIEID
jgi:hypothetical protein